MSNVEAIKKALEVAETLREYTDIDANEGANRDVVASSYAACDAITELSTTLEALQRENERLQSEIDRNSSMPGDHRYWEGRYRDEAAENERLREALEPFSVVLDEYDPDDENDFTPGTLVVGSVTNYDITLGDLRRARAALASAGEEHHAE